MDLVGYLPYSNGYTHLFTIIDRSTRWAEVIPLANTSTKDCVDAYFFHWIAGFGIPGKLTSDRG